MGKRIPLDQIFIVSIWLEAMFFGFLSCLFLGSLYLNLTLREIQTAQSKITFYAGILMFLVASLHIAVNGYRLVEGFAIQMGRHTQYMQTLASWHHVLKDALFATQEILGDLVAIYRTWAIWGYDWRPVAVPIFLTLVSIVSGYFTCYLFTLESPGTTIFNPRIELWITIFNAVAFIQSGVTTVLIAYRIWDADKGTSRYSQRKGRLFSILRILVESASLQFFSEILLFGLYISHMNAQYIVFEVMTPLVAITFNIITIRIALRSKCLHSLQSYHFSTVMNIFSSAGYNHTAHEAR